MNLFNYAYGLVSLRKLFILFTLISSLPIYLKAQSVSKDDSLALVDIFHNLNGYGWSRKTGWLISPVKQWTGITLSQDGTRVITINLSSNNMEGTLPSSIGNLSRLEILDLSYNRISGSIPLTIGDLMNLKYLRITSNSLSGEIPSAIGNCTQLVHLYIPGNKLTGSIPAEIGNLTLLTQLKLFQNQLTGEVPSQIISMSSLQIVELGVNQLEGDFPPFPLSVTKLDIAGNRLTGIPDMSGNLPALKILYIYGNTLSFDELAKVYLLGITTINYHSQRYFPVEVKNESGNLTFTMKSAGRVKTYYRWYHNDNMVYSGPDSSYAITQAAIGDRFYAEARSNQIFSTRLYSDTITVQEEITPEIRYIINSSADKQLANNAPDGLCTTGDSIMVDGEKVPECTFRAAIELVNAMQKTERTDFTFNMQQGAVIVPQFTMPVIRYPIGLDGSTQEGGMVFLKGTGVDNFTDQPSTGISLKNTENVLIRNISVEEYATGVSMENVAECGILDCKFISNTRLGIQAVKSGKLVLRDNLVDDQPAGFLLSELEEASVYGNNIQLFNNGSMGNAGITLAGVNSSQLRQNVISMQKGSYRESSGGLTLIGSHNNVIDSNYIHSCPGGITLTLCRENKITDNFLVNNDRGIVIANRKILMLTYRGNNILRNTIGKSPAGIPGIHDMNGIYIEESYGDIIHDNSIANQKEYGISGDIVCDVIINYNTIGSETNTSEGNTKGGIRIQRLYTGRVMDNVISGNGGTGLSCSGINIDIDGNYIGTNRALNMIIENEGEGIFLGDVYNTLIKSNEVHGNSGSGLVIEDATGKCTVENNRFGKEGFLNFGNGKKGIQIKGNRICLHNNHILDQHTSHGVYLERKDPAVPDMLDIYNNRILNNQFGMLTKDFSHGKITNNRIRYNFSSGLTIQGQGEGLVCTMNDISDNGGGTGIHIEDASVIVRGNQITSDETDGISVEGNGKVLVSGNNITGNNRTGVNNPDGKSFVDARENWWGHPSGPGGQGPGAGDAISANVSFDPWKTSPTGVVIAGPADTLMLPAGVRDTFLLFFRNWIVPSGNLEVTIEDSLGWMDIHEPSFILPLVDSTGVSMRFGVLAEAADAGKINTIRVKGRSVSDASNADSLVLFLTAGMPNITAIKILPDTVTIFPGDTVLFDFMAFDQFFRIAEEEVNWQAEGGSISASGLYIAGGTAGTYSIKARHEESGISDSAIVVIRNPVNVPAVPTPVIQTPDMIVYPNPSNGEINLKFNIPQTTDAVILVHAMNGSLIKKLPLYHLMPADYVFSLDIRTSSGMDVKDGIYMVTLMTAHGRETVKILVIR